MDRWETVHVLGPRRERVRTRAAQRYERRRRAERWGVQGAGAGPAAVAQARRLERESIALIAHLVAHARREP